MAFTGISLTDKTIVISGRFGLLMQSLTQALTESGADVALLTNNATGAQRFCQNISELREVSDKYGRAAAIQSEPKNEEDARMGFGKSAEYFGTTDAYIDLNLFGAEIPFYKSEDLKKSEDIFSSSLNITQLMTQGALQFVRGRSRSRILYIFNEFDLLTLEKAQSKVGKNFLDFIKKQAVDSASENITINGLSVGATEEFLLSRFPKKPSIQLALKELQESAPERSLIDYNDISNVVTFIASPYSGAITGQVISL